VRAKSEGIVVAVMLSVSFPASAAEPRELHINVGSSGAPLVATVHVEDYSATPIDLFAPAAKDDSPLTRLLKSYFVSGKAGDTKKFVSLFESQLRAGAADYYSAAEILRDQFVHLSSVRMSGVLYWGEYQFPQLQYEMKLEEGGTRRWTWSQPVHCGGDVCEMTDHFKNGQLGREINAAFANKQDAVPAPGAMLLPILPIADSARPPATSDPIVLQLNPASDQTRLAVSAVISGTVSSVYSLGSDVCVAVLKSPKDRSVRVLALQRKDAGWTIMPDPSSLDAWLILSSASTAQALQDR
jgi:hypothetical protein